MSFVNIVFILKLLEYHRNTSGNLSPNHSVLALDQSNELRFRYSLDQQTSSHACQNDTVKVTSIHLRLHQLTHGRVVAFIATERR